MSAGTLIKYKTRSYGKSIELVDVVRETEASVFIAGTRGRSERRLAKVSTYERYHDSWADAHTHLLQVAEDEVDHARRSLEAANGKLGNVKGMKPPAGGAK